MYKGTSGNDAVDARTNKAATTADAKFPEDGHLNATAAVSNNYEASRKTKPTLTWPGWHGSGYLSDFVVYTCFSI